MERQGYLKGWRMRFALGIVVVLAIIAVLLTGPRVVSDRVVVLTDGISFGSGAVIGETAVLTAKHVAERPDLVVVTPDGRRFPVVRTDLDPDDDVAVVYVDEPLGIEPLEVSTTPLGKGDEVVVVGTPGLIELAGSVMRGRVVCVDVEIQGRKNLDVHDCHSEGGCSGGPLISVATGKIVGVQVMGNGNLGCAVPCEEVDVWPFTE